MPNSYNGWPASPDKSAINVQNFGDAHGFPFPGGVRGGDVATVLGYVATALHTRVEPCVSGWCWGYEYRENVNNPGSLSCHASATAIDWNAPTHSNQSNDRYMGFDDDQVSTIYTILDEVQGAVQWGGDYSGTFDPMHFEIIVDADTLARVAASLPDGPSPTPDPGEIPMALIVRRAAGVDYGYTEDLSFFIRIPTEAYYANLQAMGIDMPDHGAAPEIGDDVAQWYRGQVAGCGGRVYEPAQ